MFCNGGDTFFKTASPLNAEALSEIKYPDTTIFYGYKKNNYEKYFFIAAGID